MNDRRRGLGRGLGALIPAEPTHQSRPTDVFFATHVAQPADPAPEPAEAAATSAETLKPVPGAHFAEIDLSRITPNPRQPRVEFDEDDLAELVQSIASVGVLQPVVVRRVPISGDGPAQGDDPSESSYELVMGERRWRACIAAGMATIPAIVKETRDDDLLRDALLENLHRSELNPLEEAAAYQQLLADFGCTQETLAERIGRSRPQISNTIRLLRLPGPVQRRVASGVLSAGHARALLGMQDVEGMERLAKRIVAEGMSVRSVEELVMLGDLDSTKASEPTTPKTRRETDPDVAAWSSRLSDRLDTRVTIAMGKRKGRLSVEFATKDDLERILSLLEPSEQASA
ncbi:MAG: ParB/RepB/Spo0J family partition protein [Ornithinimicrobium sp.]